MDIPMLLVDLVYDDGCPNVALARNNLMRAFASVGVAARWHEHRIGDPGAPARVRGFGSPTILVDGRDVAGHDPAAEACCRLYAGDRAPSVDAIARALRGARS
jgi:mercuric ion transport protein